VGLVLAHRDEAAFRQLYRRHTPALYRIASRLTQDRDNQAEEIVHDAWLRAAERWASFGWRSSLRTWLIGILLNRLREAHRSWRREPLDSLDGDIAEAAPARVEDRLDLEAAVRRLPPGYRAVLILHDIEGHTHEEIADLLGLEAGTSKSQLSRARRAVRRWLDPDSEHCHDFAT
jgi:RNA polymerase sigma-70 factor (ECF subfamily)